MANNRLSNAAFYFDGTVATSSWTTLPYPGMLGQFFNKDGKKYQLVKNASTSNALAANDVCFWSDFDDFEVSTDCSDTTGCANRPAGIALGTVAAGSYCFIQVRGPYATIRTNQDDDIAAGDTIIVDTDEDGQCDSVALGTASTHVPLAIATAADVDADDTVAGILIPPLNGE